MSQPDVLLTPEGTSRAIEESFPVEEINRLAALESCRKEIFRPVYHIHKWWANRLGSVFRALVLGAVLPSGKDIWQAFYRRHKLSDICVLDPFMGSGTTLGEAAKLGARPIGCDINPVSTFTVRQALTGVETDALTRTFHALERDIKPAIERYYTTLDRDTGAPVPVLYCFWVCVVDTPEGEAIPLFSSYVFGRHANPRQHPEAKIMCPDCWAINTGRCDDTRCRCAGCGHQFNPQQGPVNNQYVTDSQGSRHRIKSLVPADGRPLRQRMYALMIRNAKGARQYVTPAPHDLALFEEASVRLAKAGLPLPDMPVRPGHNTDQAIGYNYRYWRDFFNTRQLLCLGLLLQRILEIEDEAIREQFLCLFSGTLEFNNMFCSFKGEGTGAVRHMFSHHVLKPERTPLENSVWGSARRSGTFASLFRTRLLRAKAYLQTPTEIYFPVDLFGETELTAQARTVSAPMALAVTDSWDAFSDGGHNALVLNGDSASLPIPDRSVDAVVTDPPYFDFVHYSELSDFFYAWLSPALRHRYPYFNRPSSSHEGEVQDKDTMQFARKLTLVFSECNRVMKDDGLLVFSFHHSKPAGWSAIYGALRDAGYAAIRFYPIHAEMKAAKPKATAKEPITLDMLLVCRKQERVARATTANGRDGQADASQPGSATGSTGALSRADLFNARAAGLLISAFKDNLTVETYGRLLEDYTGPDVAALS